MILYISQQASKSTCTFVSNSGILTDCIEMHQERSKSGIKNVALKLIKRRKPERNCCICQQSTVRSGSASKEKKASRTPKSIQVSRLSLLPDFTENGHSGSISSAQPKDGIELKISAPITKFIFYKPGFDDPGLYDEPQAVKSVVSLADISSAEVDPLQTRGSCAQDAGRISKALCLFGEINGLTRDFLCSFCIIDNQFEGNPISVASRDLLPKGQVKNSESLYLSNNFDTNDWTIRSAESGDSVSRFLILKQPLFQRQGSQHSHQLFAQLDVTKLVEDVRSEGPEEDVWLYVAAEELGKLSIKDDVLLRHLSMSKPVTVQSINEARMNIIRCFYRLFFVLCQPSSDSGVCAVTHVSSCLLQHEAVYTSKVANAFRRDCFDIQKQLSRGERFFFDIREDTTEGRQLVCCVPMFGPDLNCWLCFLISGPVFERYLASCLKS